MGRPAFVEVGAGALARASWRAALACAVLAGSCITLTPDGAGVSVFRGRLDALPADRRMPEGCELLSSTPPTDMTELDLEGQRDPFRAQRNQAGAAGANALLVLSRMTVSRHDGECPSTSPITDCPPSFGAWYKVVVEGYRCPSDALRRLSAAPARASGSSSLDGQRSRTPE